MYWKLFNILVPAFGVSLIVVSTFFIVLISAPILGIHIKVNYEPGLLVIFIPLIVLGVFIIKTKKYYPKQYREFDEDNS